MNDNAHTLTFETTGRNKHDSLYEFISTRINPLLDAGWIVLSLNVIAPQEESNGASRIEVVMQPGIWAASTASAAC